MILGIIIGVVGVITIGGIVGVLTHTELTGSGKYHMPEADYHKKSK